MSSLKKMKMERLSPIPENEVQMQTIVQCLTPTKPLQFKNDVYAIEVTSSPEVDTQLPPKISSDTRLPKRRRGRHTVANPKSRITMKNSSSTPLSGLISRKIIQMQQNLPFNAKSEPRNLNAAEKTPQNTVVTIDEEPSVDKMLEIDSFSPQKTSPLFINTPQLDFPTRKSTPADIKFNPLSGIVVRKPSTHKSSDDSLNNLRPMDVDSDEDDKKAGVDLEATIEPSVSPMQTSKPPSSTKFHHEFLEVSQFLQTLKSTRSVKLGDSIVRKELDLSSVEMCGVERKKPKRTLDFSSHPLTSPISDPKVLNTDIAGEEHVEGLGPVETKQSSVNDHKRADETDSVIGGSPKSVKTKMTNEIDDLCGFTQCSKSSADLGFPIVKLNRVDYMIHDMTTPCKVVPPAVIDDASADTPPRILKMPFSLISEDESSSDEIDNERGQIIPDNSDDGGVFSDIDAEVIDDPPDSYPLKLDFTKKTIQCVESPVKGGRQFSEAVNIETAYSPDSDELKEADQKEDTIDTTTTVTTEEDVFVAESEDVRPRKRLKKGTLVDQVASVISRIEASKKLFEYEIKANLCTSSNKSQVSDPLVVCHKWIDDASTVIHICKPLKRYETSAEDYPEAEQALFICIMANETSFGIRVGSVVLLHFPITVIKCHSSKIPYVLAGSRLVLQQPESTDLSEKISADRSLDSLISMPKIEFSDQLVSAAQSGKSTSIPSMKVFSTRYINTVPDAVFAQSLVDELLFNLTILHVVSVQGSTQKQVVAFCCDDQDQLCMINFQNPGDIKRAKALEKLHILADGVRVETRGFVVINREIMCKKLKTVFYYSLNKRTTNEIVYTLTPSQANWVIMSSGTSRMNTKTLSSFGDISAENKSGKRYLVKILGIRSSNGDILVKDSSDVSLKICYHDETFKNRYRSLALPFLLDGVFCLSGILYSDEYTALRIAQKI